jgi:hypothetical protein
MRLSNGALAFIFLFIPSTLSAFITFPLYIDPSNWSQLYQAIAANPLLTFQLIINPSSGPGTSQYPSSNYITGLTKLNAHSNVKLLGYVYVSYGSRAQSAVQNDVSLYAGWSAYTQSNIRVDGIFFDEVPESYTTADYNYLSSITAYARSAFPGGYLTFNPGVVCDSRYFALVNWVNVFEDYYSSYGKNTLSSIPTTLRSQSTMIIHDFTGNQKTQATLVQNIAASGIRGLYITTAGGYTSYSKLWSQFATEMAATGP